MTNFSHHLLQSSIYQLLVNDAALGALIEGVYDRPVQGTEFPYLTLGESIGADWSTKTTRGMEHTFTIHAWSRDGGRKQASSIMERIHTLIHQADLAVSGQTTVVVRFISSAIELESDGWTYHGIMRFQALLEANS
jgi:hypothetical protein